jgi:uncharacterized repeat protein (TIGR03806 family)
VELNTYRYFLISLAMMIMGCSSPPAPPVPSSVPIDESPPTKLSAYELFEGDPKAQRPAVGVIPYDLNSPLFTDYAEKFRFVKLPKGASAVYSADDVFSFPVGTIIAKTFAYPVDARDPSMGRRLIETRVLLHQTEGWVGLPYLWNDAQTEATLELAGSLVDVAWIHHDGRNRTNNYIIPNANQCKGCHKIGDVMQPIGPSARQLNRDFDYAGGSVSQIRHWEEIGALKGHVTQGESLRLAVWDDPKTGSVDDRARAWLEINCAHCHRPDGPAKNSGLDLRSRQQNPVAFGVFKAPVAAGQGSGGRAYDIVPGKPDDSILAFRIASTHPGIMMPELGKRLVHEEGVALIRHWISEMKATEPQKSISLP